MNTATYKAIADVKPQELADAFGKVLRTWLTHQEIAVILLRNSQHADDNYCATHDFCDANMAMLDALDGLTDEVVDVTDESTVNLMNAAWSLAKVNKFIC